MRIAVLIPILLFLAISALGQTPLKVSIGPKPARAVKFTPASDFVAFATGNKVKMYRSGIEVTSFSEHHSKINDFSFDQDGALLVACHDNGHLTIWNTSTNAMVKDFKTTQGRPLGCKFLESDQRVVLLSDQSVSFWSAEGELLNAVKDSARDLSAMAISRHGRLVAVAGGSQKIVLYDGLGNRVSTIKTPQKEVIALAIAPNGKTMASGGSDGTIQLWGIESGGLVETLLKTKGRINSLEFSSDSKYLAAGTESFFILSISKDQPDVVYRKLAGAVLNSSFSPNGKQVCIIEDLTPFAKIYDIADLNIPPVFLHKDEQDNIAPQIYISNPSRIINDRINYSRDMIEIQGSIFDDYGVKNLKINGIETPIRENGKFILHLALAMGENPVDFEASDINGNSSIKRFIINRKGNAEEYDPQVARNFLFVAGIDHYQHWPALNNAVKDGTDLTNILMKSYNFDLANVTLMKDEQATQNNIYTGLRGLIEKITPKDNLIIYFSGHGYFDELLNEGFWIPVDAATKAEAEYISNSSVLRIIENISTQHTLLIADACFSGSLFFDSRRGVREGYVEKVEKIRSRWGLASGRLEAVSDGEAGTNSPFARVLLNFLGENSKTELTVSELVQHVKMKVAEESDQTPIGNPLRISGEEGGEFVFRKSRKD